MGIQINGTTDTISASDGSLSIAGQELTGVTDINASGIVTASQVQVGTAVTVHATGFQVGSSSIYSTGATLHNINSTGIITATSFSGDGSQLSNIISGVGIQSAGTLVGTGFTTLNFIGAGNTFAVNGTTIDISISGGGAENVRTNSLVVSGVSTFAADNSNRILVGTNTARSFNSATARIHIEGTDLNSSSITVVRNSNDANEAKFIFAKTRGTAVNTAAGISSADSIGRIEFNFTDSGNNSQNIGYIQATNYRTTTNYGGGLIFAVKRDGASSEEVTIFEESGTAIFGGGRGTGTSNGVIDNISRGLVFVTGHRSLYRGTIPSYTSTQWIGGGTNNGGYGWIYTNGIPGEGGAYVPGGYFVGSHGENVYGGSCGVVGLGGNGGRYSQPGSGGFFQPGFTGEDGSGGVRSGNFAFGGRAHQYDVLYLDRTGNDGTFVTLRQDGTEEGTITVSGTTVSYNGGHLSRWSQFAGIDPYNKNVRPEILLGTVMSNLDEMCEWITPEKDEVIWTQEEIDRCISIYGQIPDGVEVGDVKIPYSPEQKEDNWQLNKTKISDVENDKNVAGVFQDWDDDDDTWVNDYHLAMTGDFVIRISSGVIVEKGDLLTSAGDGTAKPQSDDLIRSSTIAKVTSNHIVTTYDDGSYCVPCVLMSC